MTTKVRISDGDFNALTEHLFKDNNEQHAFLYAGRVTGDSEQILCVRKMRLANPLKDLAKQTGAYLSLRPAYALEALDTAAQEGLHIIDCHSHPFCAEGVRFSSTDLRAAERRFQWHQEHLPEMLSTGLVLGRRSFEGKTVQGYGVISLTVVGQRLQVWTVEGTVLASQPNGRFDRQIRAFGEQGHRAISSCRAAIVGCGGTGSVLVQQLAHLGVRDFVLVDPDTVELTNLNRLAGASHTDVGRPKVDVVADAILRIEPTAAVNRIADTIGTEEAEREVACCDVIFGCGDNQGVRYALNDLSYRALVPYWDLGTGIEASDGAIARIGGQVVMVGPGRPCHVCRRSFDSNAVTRGLRSAMERADHAAAYGTESPQPAVMGLNSVVASLATCEFIKWATGWAAPNQRLQFDDGTSTLTQLETEVNPDCSVCGRERRYGLGTDNDRRFVSPIPEVGGCMR